VSWLNADYELARVKEAWERQFTAGATRIGRNQPKNMKNML
jgi:hypothetical protein